jgi:hypothetical protein
MEGAIATDSLTSGIIARYHISLAATLIFRLPFALVWKALTKSRFPGMRGRRPDDPLRTSV